MRFDELRTLSALVLVAFLFAQSGANDKKPNPAITSVSKAVDAGTLEYRMFEDDLRKVKFALVCERATAKR